jgi:lysophospholipase L1-like esterase
MKRAHPSLLVLIAAIAASSVFLAASPFDAAQPAPGEARWRTAWTTSQQTLGTSSISNTTVRLIARVTVGGDALRLRLDNAYGTAPLKIASVYVGVRARGAALVPGSNRRARFAGAESVTVPPGGSVRSDPVDLRVMARQDLAVSLFVPEAGVQPSQHSGALVTSYLAPADAGDHAAKETDEAFKATMTTMPWLKAIDARSASSTGVIVAFGDSITDGTCTTVDAYERWEDWLAVRLALDADRRNRKDVHKAVVNEGIGGNTVTREGLQPPPDSTPGIERLERDVLSHEGVTDVILFMGTNDIRRGASAAQVIAGMSQIAQRVKARGAKVFGATIIPRHNAPAAGTNTGWNDEKTAIRREVNQWIRSRAAFDGVLDFDAVVRDPAHADLIMASFNCDGIHPSPRGYYEMGRSVALDLFAR